MKRIKKYLWPTFIGVTIAFCIAAFWVRLPYYIEVPGGAEDVRQVLLVDNKADKEAGSYNFVTVGVEQATFAHLVYAWLTPFTDIYSAKDMTGAPQTMSLIGSTNFTWKHRKIWLNIRG